MNLEDIKKLNIPSTPGCYQFFDSRGKLVYIGKAANLRNRVYSYWRISAAHTPAKQDMVKEIADVKWIETDSEIEALLLESNLVKKYQPYYNVALRDDKRFSYIKISTADEIPGVFISRKIDKAGKYFGPFTSGLAARETVKALRKIWPFCTERRVKTKPCFYYQIGRCTGVCAGRFDIREYREKIIKSIIMFLEGKKQLIIKKMEAEIKKLEKEIPNIGKALNKKNSVEAVKNQHIPLALDTVKVSDDFSLKEKLEEELSDLKFQLINMRKVLEHTKILGVAEKYAADVVELAKILGLPKTPKRIEGYDISNIFGREAVGAMVVFRGGEPDKNEYRKFKIRIEQGRANDVGMLKEMLERRFQKHAILKTTSERSDEPQKQSDQAGNSCFAQDGREFWSLPDLIIIDGGKAQLNAALRVLKKYKLDIAVIAISKGEGLRSSLAPDKLFFPGEKTPLELPLASPALHIIKRVRDEAHRFAISYHRFLRKKEWIK